MAPVTSIGIIGSGFGAVAVAVEMLQHGHDDVRLWERSGDLGGVWRDNTYPGAGCDVPSPLYSFSYAPNPSWSRRYALQEEIHAYIRDVADRFGVSPLIQYRREVTAAAWDEETATWTVTFSDGATETVDVLVSAVGQLSEPVVPTLPGIDSFAGPSFHTARWNHDVDLRGRTVAVVGSGASAVQLVPHVAEQAERLVLFQRSPNYLMPKPDQPYTKVHSTLFHRLPITQTLERGGIWTIMEQFARGLDDTSRMGPIGHRIAMRHLRKQVEDPELRAKLTPDYPIGCKRVLFSNEFYPALARPNVEVVTHGVQEVREDRLIDSTGREHEVDVVIYATGFDSQDFLSSIDVRGEGGEKLATRWADGARAYLGMYVPGFPNLLVTYGPNTNLGGGSIIYMLEAQARHMRQVVDRLEIGRYRSVQVTERTEADYDAEIQERLDHSVWGDCEHWYRHPPGRITSNWPGATLPFAQRTRTLDPTEFTWA
jgi:cation diffusion facilitator CzcD-associated flavoprotein CzcO